MTRSGEKPVEEVVSKDSQGKGKSQGGNTKEVNQKVREKLG